MRNFLIILLLLSFCSLWAQTSSNEHKTTGKGFDRTEWKELTKDIDYSSDQIEKQEPQQEQRQQQRTYSEGVGFLGKFILLAIGVVVVFFLVRSLAGYDNPTNRKLKSDGSQDLNIAIEQAEENIPESDMERLLRRAIEQKSYNLAIRLYFLNILKELAQKGLINWKKDKTNRAYSLELVNSEFHNGFKKSAIIFDRVWYGNTTLNQEEFNLIEPGFQSLIQAIKK